MVWLSCAERRGRYISDHGHTLLGFLPVGAVELRERAGDRDVDDSMFMHGSASLGRRALEDTLAQEC